MHFHLFRPDLLGARILNLGFGSALADISNQAFCLHWPTFHKFAGQSGYALSDNLFSIYDEKLLLRSQAFQNGSLDNQSFAVQQSWGEDLIHSITVGKREGRPLTIASLAKANVDAIFSHVEPLAIGGISLVDWAARARDNLLTLPHRSDVLGAEANLISDLPRGRLVAIHIRRGDIVRDILSETSTSVSEGKRPKSFSNFLMRFVPFSTYRYYLADQQFDAAILFSDEPDIIGKSQLNTLLPVYDVTSAVQALPLTKIQRDFIEVRLMARADTLLASQSRFSQLATLYSGRQAVDLSGTGEASWFLDEMINIYGLKRDHPVFSQFENLLLREVRSA